MHVTSKIDEFASYGLQTCTFISAALHVTLEIVCVWTISTRVKTIVCIATTATVGGIILTYYICYIEPSELTLLLTSQSRDADI